MTTVPNSGGRSPRSINSGDLRSIHVEDVARARALIARTDHDGLAELFGALGDPTRLAIVQILLAQEMCTCDLAATLRLSEPAVSQHLRILRNLDMVTWRRAGRMVYYAVDDRTVRKLVDLASRRQPRQPRPRFSEMSDAAVR
jgi:ArsR family transcriptional regulator, lead/cadmium/zinc/bismuth-responsive transcriptional repressor